MARITGIGGIFLRAQDRAALSAWYRDVLGLPMQDWHGAMFMAGGPPEEAPPYSLFTLFAHDTPYFGPGGKACMVNFVVDDLDGLLSRLRAAGAGVDEKVEDSEYGRFGWVTDPEGNRIELWQPARG